MIFHSVVYFAKSTINSDTKLTTVQN